MKPIFKWLRNSFLQGLVTVLPIAITFSVLYWLAVSTERILGRLIKALLPDNAYWPGMGIVLGVVVIFCIGLLVKSYFVKNAFSYGEAILARLPIVKTLYISLRDLTQFISSLRNKSENLKQVVLVKLAEDMRVIGFITNPEVVFNQHDSMTAVYIPFGYQIGGYTLYMPASKLEYLDITVEDAMRLVLTANMSTDGVLENKKSAETSA